jgi:hypothetical protein
MKRIIVMIFAFTIAFTGFSQETATEQEVIATIPTQSEEELRLLKEQEKAEQAQLRLEKQKVKLEKQIVSQNRAIAKGMEKEAKLRRKLTEGHGRGKLSPVEVMKLNRQIDQQKRTLEKDKLKLSKLESKRS